MAPSSVSEHRATRAQMGHAAAEIAANLRALAIRFDGAPKPSTQTRTLAYHVRRLAALFDRLELEAIGERPIPDSNLRTMGRVFNDIAIKLGETVELVEHIESAIALTHLGQKISRVGDLTGQALMLADVRL